MIVVCLTVRARKTAKLLSTFSVAGRAGLTWKPRQKFMYWISPAEYALLVFFARDISRNFCNSVFKGPKVPLGRGVAGDLLLEPVVGSDPPENERENRQLHSWHPGHAQL